MKHKFGFIEWMSYVKNVHQGNKPAMDRALTKLSEYDNEESFT